MSDSLERLFTAVHAVRGADPAASRTARLLHAGRQKVAKKFGEEAVEVVIEALGGDREALVRESADLVYHLVVLWVAEGVSPQEVWAEMQRRESLFGIAEKVNKSAATTPKSRRPVVMDARRARRHRS
ncbi:MAG: phosphoribosyl-ATP diphosphatase [Proteobacteria bacterium]|nr:phosphoribosyl-ATP diphosphatase [Pseudomonadota bacterium]